MAKPSAGLLIYRIKADKLEVFLVHPGGQWWENKDEHSCSIPKGEYTSEEEPFEAAKREFISRQKLLK
jgi:predicted NUDIX family NTP pyrophosphohydrolase